MFDPVFDRHFEFRQAGECASPDALAGDIGEQPLDEIEPRVGCRREVNMEAGMALEPALHGGCFMGGVVVGDEVKAEMGLALRGRSFSETSETRRRDGGAGIGSSGLTRG